WLSEALGWGIASGAVVSSLAFGYAHMYQGWRGMVKTSAAGAIFLAVFLLTGSIWPAVWLHALGDLVAGWLAYHAYGKLGQTPGSGADGAPKSATGMAPEAADMLDSSSVPSAR
ncbi:MAG: CPBP family intramembrane metalloprotease, partial [Holophagales bacterium]|nr:CPBP family intramembrane metalloprotease [Holophagales bacterium]